MLSPPPIPLLPPTHTHTHTHTHSHSHTHIYTHTRTHARTHVRTHTHTHTHITHTHTHTHTHTWFPSCAIQNVPDSHVVDGTDCRDGTAIGGKVLGSAVDYLESHDQVNFEHGETSKNIIVEINKSAKVPISSHVNDCRAYPAPNPNQVQLFSVHDA